MLTKISTTKVKVAYEAPLDPHGVSTKDPKDPHPHFLTHPYPTREEGRTDPKNNERCRSKIHVKVDFLLMSPEKKFQTFGKEILLRKLWVIRFCKDKHPLSERVSSVHGPVNVSTTP